MDEWEARMRKATTDPRLPPTVCKDFVSALACIDALRKEAERYRWLRDEADFVRRKEGSPQVCITDEWGEIVSVKASAYPHGAVLDAAIDAELALHNASLSGQPCCIKTDAEK